MDLSINKLKNMQKVNNLPNFKGFVATYNNANTPVYKFFPIPYDVRKNDLYLEFIHLDGNSDSVNQVSIPDENDVYELKFNGSNPVEILQEQDLAGYAYRYKIKPKGSKEEKDQQYILDAFERIKGNNGGEYNLVRLSKGYNIYSKRGPIRHSFVDSDAIIEGTEQEQEKKSNASKQSIKDWLIEKIFGNRRKKLATNKKVPRNHFNKFGGSTEGLIALLLQTKELDPYKYILSTPDMGKDPTSSHKYWPNNLYQTTNYQAFKDLNYALFVLGKGYIADGAFTSQSLQSPLFQHVLKWGEESPFYNMFKIDGKPVLGVLPDVIADNADVEGNDTVRKHIGVRIVNSPLDKDYTLKKPTYIQFYDDRLTKTETISDTKNLISAYDKNPEDIFEITANDDSIYPYYFELDIDRDASKIKLFKSKETNHLSWDDINSLSNDFFEFKNFSIGTRSQAAGATYWDGNRDIVKLNLSNPNDTKENINGMKAAREYLFGVADFHTEAIQSYLLLRSAQASEKQREIIAGNNGVKITRGQQLHPILDEPKGIERYTIDFPLQSLETSPELSAIFSEPEFKEELKKDILKTVQGKVDTTIDVIVKNKGLGSEEAKEYKIYVTKTYVNEILRYIYAASLGVAQNNGEVDLEKLKQVTLKSVIEGTENSEKIKIDSTNKERTIVINAIKKGLENVNLSSIQEKIKNELKDVSLDDFKEAETLIIQSKAGLNWRFDAAKDIGDLDNIREKENAKHANFIGIWDGPDGVVDFWQNFISRVKKYNPSAYLISELTVLGEFIDYNNAKFFDRNGADSNQKEKNFMVQTGSTTSSNYSYYFNKLSCLLGTNPEHFHDGYDDPQLLAGDLFELRSSVIDFIKNNQPNLALSTHEFFDNHDKPRLMHCLPLNMELFLWDTDHNDKLLDDYIKNIKDEKKKEAFKEDVKKLTGGREDYYNMSPMAIAVGLMYKKQIEDSKEIDSELKNKLNSALTTLVNGQKKDGGQCNFKRAKSFGTKPYEITIREMFRRAEIPEGEELENYIKDFHSSILKYSMDYMERLWQVMNAIVGMPTLFNGTEFAQTGYETLSKNVYVDNRNQILHELKDDIRYKPMYDKIFATQNLYQELGMSAIRDGFPVVCQLMAQYSDGESPYAFDSKISDSEKVDLGKIRWFFSKIKAKGGMNTVDKLFANGNPSHKDIKDKLDIDGDDNCEALIGYYKNGKLKEFVDFRNEQLHFLPIFKYDDNGSQVLSIITDNGIPKQVANESQTKIENRTVKEIPIKDEKGRCPVPEGTIFVRKIYNNGKYIDDTNSKYKIENGMLKEISGKDIQIDDTVLNFYIPPKNRAEYSPFYAQKQ